MITLEVNGGRYTGFTKIDVSRDFKESTGKFSFEGSLRSTGVAPIKIGDTCKIFINETQFLTGYIEHLQVDYSDSNKTITLSGRDVIADLIDSTLPVGVEFKGSVTLQQVARKVLDTIGLTHVGVVTNTTIEPFGTSDLTSAAIGDKAFQFLEKYSRKRQVIATTDGKGNLLLARASTQQINSQLINSITGRSQGNILNATLKYDNSKRFYKYVVYSQSNASADPNAYNSKFGVETLNAVQANTNIQGQAFDNEIRKSRVHAFIAESSSQFATLNDRAKWEANIRRAEALTYTAKVSGVTATQDGFVWQPNMLVQVIDEDCDIRAPMLIKKVSFNLSADEGETTTLELVTKDAFTLEAERIVKDKRKNKQGDKFNDAAFGVT